MLKMLTDELDQPEVQCALNGGYLLVSIDEACHMADENFEFPTLDNVTACDMRQAQWTQIHRRLVARFDAEAKDRTGQSMRLAAALRSRAAKVETLTAIDRLCQQARAFDERSDWLYRFGYLQSRLEPCEKYVDLDARWDGRVRQLDPDPYAAAFSQDGAGHEGAHVQGAADAVEGHVRAAVRGHAGRRDYRQPRRDAELLDERFRERHGQSLALSPGRQVIEVKDRHVVRRCGARRRNRASLAEREPGSHQQERPGRTRRHDEAAPGPSTSCRRGHRLGGQDGAGERYGRR